MMVRLSQILHKSGGNGAFHPKISIALGVYSNYGSDGANAGPAFRRTVRVFQYSASRPNAGESYI
jgi:hypothetical protein